MSTLIWIAGTLGLGGVALAFTFWRLVKRSNQAEVLKDAAKQKDALLEGLEIARKAHLRYESDPGFAKRVLKRFTRRN